MEDLNNKAVSRQERFSIAGLTDQKVSVVELKYLKIPIVELKK